MSSHVSHHRVIAYHQAHGTGDDYVPLAPMVDHGLTHLIVAAVHLEDDGRVVLNDHEHTDTYHDRLWTELALVQERGLRCLAMVGGWAPGTMCKLDTDDFDRYYPVLRDFLREHRFDGVDIDVEQDMSLEGVVALVDALRADFGPEFTIILAPVASAMWGGDNLSGFDYEELYRLRGHEIEFVNVQFYSGFGTMATASDYERILARGVYPVDKLVAGMVGHPEDANGFVPLDQVCRVLAELCERHPDFGGVDIWEYFRALPGDRQAPWEWIDLMRETMHLGALTTPADQQGEVAQA